jgi:hypothetical protein
MFKGFEHTVRCTKCQEVTVACGKSVKGFEKAEKLVASGKSECCGAAYEYIGLQPVMAPVLNLQVKKASGKPKAEPEPAMAMVNTAAAEPPTVKVDTVAKEAPTPTVVKPEPVAKAEPIVEQASNINEDGIEVVDWIDQKKKMNNDYMVQLLRDAMDNEEDEKIEFLKANYPDVFQKSLRYIPAKLKRCFGL